MITCSYMSDNVSASPSVINISRSSRIKARLPPMPSSEITGAPSEHLRSILNTNALIPSCLTAVSCAEEREQQYNNSSLVEIIPKLDSNYMPQLLSQNKRPFVGNKTKSVSSLGRSGSLQRPGSLSQLPEMLKIDDTNNS